MFSTLIAKFPGTCKRCHTGFPAGTKIRYGGRGRTYHLLADCIGANDAPTEIEAGHAPNLDMLLEDAAMDFCPSDNR